MTERKDTNNNFPIDHNDEEIDIYDLEEMDIVEEKKSDSSLLLPRLEIEGVVTEEEIMFLKGKVSNNSDGSSLPLYVVFGMEKIKCGYLELSLDNILEIRFIGSNKYVLTLISEEGSVDILSPKLGELGISKLLNFIRVR